MADREDVLFQAKLAEQAERYDGKGVVVLHEVVDTQVQKWWRR